MSLSRNHDPDTQENPQTLNYTCKVYQHPEGSEHLLMDGINIHTPRCNNNRPRIHEQTHAFLCVMMQKEHSSYMKLLKKNCRYHQKSATLTKTL